MRYEDIHKTFLGNPAAWFEVDEIYNVYITNLANGWEMPVRWLVSVEYEIQLKGLSGMYGLRIHENGGYSIASIPALVGKFDFRIAAVAEDPCWCRVGDFVENNVMPTRFLDRDTIYLHPVGIPKFQPSGDVSLPPKPLPSLVFHKRKFFDGAGTVFTLWRRES